MKTFTAKINAARATMNLGNMSTSPTAALSDYVENSLDAGAKEVYIVLGENTVEIVDDGHGMVEYIDHADHEKIRQYMEDLKNGHLPPGARLKDYVSQRSISSIEYMMNHIAFSGKAPEDDELIRGEKGIGCLAFLQIARDITYLTLPSFKLMLNRPPFPFKLVPPNRDQLARDNMDYQVGVHNRPLESPYNKKLTSGTRVIIQNLNPGVEHRLRPAYVAEYMQERFGFAVESGCRIVVIDRATNEGKKSRGGKEYVIKPPEYSGVPLVKVSRALKGGRGPFTVELYYDSQGRDLRIDLRRRGSNVNSLVNVPGLNIAPFNSGKISGYVGFPDIVENERLSLWSATKSVPNESDIKTQWVDILREIAKEAQATIGDITQRATDVTIKKIANVIARHALDAMSEDPLLIDSLRGTTHSKVPSGAKRGYRNTVPHSRTEAVVKNEHRSPVEDVSVRVSALKNIAGTEQKEVGHWATGVTGQISFGVLAPGQYIMRVTHVPEGHRLISAPERMFRITEDNPRERITFIVENGMRPTGLRQLRKLELWMHPFADPGIAYSIERMKEYEQLEINTEFPALRDAMDRSDELRQMVLLADFISSAVVEYVLNDLPLDRVMAAKSRHFAAMMESLGISDNRKKARK